MKKPSYQNIKWLKVQYLGKKRTLKDIGEECGVCWGAIGYWCKKFKIPLRDPKSPEYMRLIQNLSVERRRFKISREWIRERYEDKDMSLKEIAKEYGCNWSAIQRRCIYYGIPLRKPEIRRSVMNRKFIIKDEFTDTKSLKNAMMKLFGYSCMYKGCKYNNFVQLHHLEGTNNRIVKNGKYFATRKHTCNKISNSVLLCPNHHAEADVGIITKEEIKSILTSRELKIKSDTLSNKR